MNDFLNRLADREEADKASPFKLNGRVTTVYYILSALVVVAGAMSWIFTEHNRIVSLENRNREYDVALGQFHDLVNRFTVTSERLNNLDARESAVDLAVGNRIDLMTRNFDVTERKVDVIETRQLGVLKRIDEIAQRLQDTITNIDRMDTPLSKKYVGLDGEMAILRDRVTAIAVNYQLLHEQIVEAQRRMNDLDAALRKVDERRPHSP